jgi:hypothetical protein
LLWLNNASQVNLFVAQVTDAEIPFAAAQFSKLPPLPANNLQLAGSDGISRSTKWNPDL